jgi:hypothetical protein
MAEKNDGVIRITADDLAAIDNKPAEPSPETASTSALEGGRSYGNIHTAFAEKEPIVSEDKPSILLQGWFYLGAAGLLGAVAGWGICEPGFQDGGGFDRWGNYWLLPMVTMLMLVCFAISESIVERSLKKAAYRLALVIPLGAVFGFMFSRIADVIFAITLRIVLEAGVRTNRNPAFWIARAVAWAAFGLAAGLCYGLVGKSSKKAKYGVLGGILGAFLGGLAFDPISLLVDQGGESRAFGFAMLGLAAGAAMGFVESALKDRWLYVSSGPLAGKQFILYKQVTTIGSDQGCDIYLFKDTSIAPQHAVIEIRGVQSILRAQAPLFVSGVPTQTRVLNSGDIIQIGRYAFRYNERHR